MPSKFLPVLVVLALTCKVSAQEPEAPAEAPQTPEPDATVAAVEPSSEPAAPEAPEVKSLLGISILGNEEAPKSLVIVPWKSSEIGEGIGVEQLLDDRPVPIDRDVFMRELRFYEIRAESPQ